MISWQKITDLYPLASDYFSWSLAAIGDADTDGVPDFVVGAPGDDTPGRDIGQVTLYSGADRLVICRAATPGNIGRAVSAIGDLDGDGVPEILAGAPTSVHHGGGAFAFTYSRVSGTCSLLFEMVDPDLEAYDNLGFSIAGLGDVTGDGIPDIAVGEPGDNSIADSNGAVVVFSGADGSFYRPLLDSAGAYRDRLGYDISGIEDINAEGWPDIVVGVEWQDTAAGSDAGEVVVFSGHDGSVALRASDPDSDGGARLGYTIAVVDDVDGDGLQDILAGARYGDVGGVTDAGRAVLFSTADGSKIATLENSANAATNLFGYAVDGAGDLTGDGVPELLVGTPYEDGAAGSDVGAFVIFSIAADCDSDGLAPFEDCDDTDANTWRVPTETRNLAIAPDKETITWDEPAGTGQGSGSLLYDTLRSSSGIDFSTATCVEWDESDRVTVDDFEPPSRFVVYYLTRAQNSCGDGDLGARDEEGHPRTGTICP